VPDFAQFLSLSIRLFSVAEWRKTAPDFVNSIKIKCIFMGLICSNFMRDAFTININVVSYVYLGEGAENKGLETNNKLGFREISLSGRH